MAQKDYHTNFQQKMLLKQKLEWEAAKEFLMKQSRSNLPVLPNDVLILIYHQVVHDLYAILWCEKCCEPVLKNKNKTLFQEKEYTLVNDIYMCNECICSNKIAKTF